MGSTFLGTPVGPSPGVETLADMTLRVARRVRDTLSGVATDGAGNSLTDIDSLQAPSGLFDGGMLWILSGTYMGQVIRRIRSHLDNTLYFGRSLGSAICARQVETLTVVGTVTDTGNARVTVTAAGMNGSPKEISVAVVKDDTASDVAALVRTALAADADVMELFEGAEGSDANVVLTAMRAAANDSTMLIEINNNTCTGLTPAQSSQTTAGAAGPHYAVTDSAIPFHELVSAINMALRTVHIPAEDYSLTGDGQTLEFTLPTGVYNVFEVYAEKSGDTYGRYFKAHWRERNGKLRFDQGFAPKYGETLHVWYAKPHSGLLVSDDGIDDDVNLLWLEAQATFNVLMWARKKYEKDPRFDIETLLQVAAADLKAQTPNKRARIMVHSGGRNDADPV